jgi:hypothetical protein
MPLNHLAAALDDRFTSLFVDVGISSPDAGYPLVSTGPVEQM